MKKRNKVVMALAALTAVTAGVATTSTLAWFTTTRSVSVNFSNLAVKTGSGSLQVAYVAGDASTTAGTNTTAGTYASSVNIAGKTSSTSNGVDISGDGKTFYRPTWNATNLTVSNTNSASAYSGVFTASKFTKLNSVDGYYVSFKVSLWNQGTNKVDVFINNGSSISAATNSDPTQQTLNNNAAAGTRIAIMDSTNILSTWQGGTETEAAGYKYVTAGSTTDYLYGVAGYKLGDTTALSYTSAIDSLKGGTTVNSWHGSNTFDTINKADDATKDGVYIGRMVGSTENTPSYLELTINLWFEGTSAHIIGSMEGATVNTSINFVSVDVGA